MICCFANCEGFSRLLRKVVFDFEDKKVLFPEVTGFGSDKGSKLVCDWEALLVDGLWWVSGDFGSDGDESSV